MVIVPLGYQSLAQREVNIFNKTILRKFTNQAVITTIISSIVFSVIWYYAVVEFELIKGLTNYDDIKTACLLIPLFGLMTFFKAILQGQNKIYPSIVPDGLLRPILLLVGLAILWTLDLEIAPVQLLLILGAIMTGNLIYSILKCFQKVPNSERKVKVNWRKQALILLPIGLLYTINERVDVIMLAKFLGGEATAIYSVAYKFAAFSGFGIVILNQVMVPHYASYFKGNITGDKLNQYIKPNVRKSFILSSIVFIGLVFIGPILLHYFGGEQQDYSEGYIPMLILAGGQVFNVSVGSVGYILTLGNQEKLVMITVGAGITINIILNIITLPIWGITGAAIATSSAMLVWNLFMYYFVKTKTAIKPSILG